MKSTIAIAVLLCAFGAEAANDLPTTAEGQREQIMETLREREREVAELSKALGVTSSLGSLPEMGKVSFVLEYANQFGRRYLHDDDHKFVYSAVKGQSKTEFEQNLPYIVNYVRLATAARNYNWNGRQRQPMVGDRRGLEEVQAIAKSVYDFRTKHVEAIKSGGIRPSQVLTRANLGDFGEPILVRTLRRSFLDGQEQFSNQRNSVVFVLIGIELLISYFVAVFIIRRAKPWLVAMEHSRRMGRVIDTASWRW